MSLDLIRDHPNVDEKAKRILDSRKVSQNLLFSMADVWHRTQTLNNAAESTPHIGYALEFDIQGRICVEKGPITLSSKRPQISTDVPGHWQHVVNSGNGRILKGIFARQTQDGRVLVVTSIQGVYDLLQRPEIEKLGHETARTRLPIYAGYPNGHHTQIAMTNIDTLNAVI